MEFIPFNAQIVLPYTLVKLVAGYIETRLSEHEKAIEKRTLEKSHFVFHLLSENHVFSRNTGVRHLHTVERCKNLTAVENVEIIKQYE